ncbi:hypothetical protein SprV_0802536100 [Sparganum proliferum]
MGKVSKTSLQDTITGRVFYGRYVDDILCLADGTTDTEDLVQKFNSAHPSIKFTAEAEADNEIAFLDALLNRQEASSKMASELPAESESMVSVEPNMSQFNESTTVHANISQPDFNSDFGYLYSDISYFQVLPTTAESPSHLSLLKEEETAGRVSMVPVTKSQDGDVEQQGLPGLHLQLTSSIDSLEEEGILGASDLGAPSVVSSTTAIASAGGLTTTTPSQLSGFHLKDARVPTSSELPTTSSVFDDALAAAMEALAQASQVNNSFITEADRLLGGSLEGNTQPEASVACPITTSSPTSSPSHFLVLSDRGRLQSVSTTVTTTAAVAAAVPATVTLQVDERQKSDHSADTANPVNVPTSLRLRDGANRRVLMRPHFEKAVVDLLWASGELGPGSPQALLLAMWFYVSRHLGIGCRTDHARLLYGNLSIGVNPQTGSKHVQFVHTADLGDHIPKLTQPPSHDRILCALPGQPERCPVSLFEAFCAHRPVSAKQPDSPFYLQPDRNAHGSIWYLRSALGKNKIGSMLNAALQRVGLPIPRHVGFSRFCDALASVVLRNMREATCRQLVDLVTATNDCATDGGGGGSSRMEQIAHLAASLTAAAVYRGSRIGEHLKALWENKRPPSPPLEPVAVLETSAAPSHTAPTVFKSTQQLDTSPQTRPVCALMTVQSPFGQEVLVPVQVALSTRSPSVVSLPTAPNSLGQQRQRSTQLPFADESIQMTFHGINPLPSPKAQKPEAAALRLGLVGIEALVPPNHHGSSSATVTEAEPGTGCADPPFSSCDIQVECCRGAVGVSRSAKLELRELLELVMSAAPDTDSTGGAFSSTATPPRSPSGLITQLLWRARALDDRGPWLLSFSMWWMLQHYFGIGSRVHHVRLKWHHLRLVSNATDPMTGAPCEALEYVGPPEFSTVKSLALLESHQVGGEVRQRVYPSSGWAEPEISVAAIIAGGNLGAEVNARLRPLERTSDVPIVPARPGPDFVALYKAFMQHRPVSSLVPDAPFYTQPLQSTRNQLMEGREVQREVWFSNAALGKNRIGALMRNIVDKVVRPRLPQLALVVKPISVAACRNAALQAARQTVIHSPTDLDATVLARRVSLVEKLCSGLGVSSTGLRSQLEQDDNAGAADGTIAVAINPKPLPLPSASPTSDTAAQSIVTFLNVSCVEGGGDFTSSQPRTDSVLEGERAQPTPVPFGASGVILTQMDCGKGQLAGALKTATLTTTGQGLVIQQPKLTLGEPQVHPPTPLYPAISRTLASSAFTVGPTTTTTSLPINFVLLPIPSLETSASGASLLTFPLSAGPSQLLLSPAPLALLPTCAGNDTLGPPVLALAAAGVPAGGLANSDTCGLQFNKVEGGTVLFHTQNPLMPALKVSTPQTTSPALYTAATSATPTTLGQLQPQYVAEQNAAPNALGTASIELTQVCQSQSHQPLGSAPTPVHLLSLADIPQTISETASLQVFSQTMNPREAGAKAPQFPLPVLATSVDHQTGVVMPAAATTNNDGVSGPPGNSKSGLNGVNGSNIQSRQNLTTTEDVGDRVTVSRLQQVKADVLETTPYQPPAEFRDPRPDELRTFQSVIQSTVALQCSNFPDYVSHLHRHGVLSLHKPWSLNFTAWFINSLAFCVENRTEHLALRWGDFRLGRCEQTSTEYLSFYNRVSQRVFFLRADPAPSDTDSALCPCPVQVYKALRERRPANCQDALSKFYLQPKSFAFNKTDEREVFEGPGPWFTEHSWGKNKLGGLLAEAAKITGLPVIWLPKRRSCRKSPVNGAGQKRPAMPPPSRPKQARTPGLLAPSSVQWTSLCTTATLVSPSTLLPLDIDGEGVEGGGQGMKDFPIEQDVPQKPIFYQIHTGQ